MAKTKAKPAGPRRYKLIFGLHHDKNGLHRAARPGTPGMNDVITSDIDLAKRFTEKFVRLDHIEDLPEAPASGATSDTFDKMSNEQLKKFAEDNEIDLEGADNREEVLDLLRYALASAGE